MLFTHLTQYNLLIYVATRPTYAAYMLMFLALLIGLWVRPVAWIALPFLLVLWSTILV